MEITGLGYESFIFSFDMSGISMLDAYLHAVGNVFQKTEVYVLAFVEMTCLELLMEF